MSSGRLKIYELAKELNQESRHVVEVVQRLGINIKNPTSFIGSEEARIVREYYRKQRTPAARPAPPPTTTVAKGVVTTEKRVGRTVIRRRSRPAPAGAPAPDRGDLTEETPQAMGAQPAPAAPVPEIPADEKIVTAKAPKEKAGAKKKTAKGGKKAKKETVEQEEEAPAAEVTAEAPAEQKPEARKWAFPSIIKKIATEKHLGETIGPKPKARPKTPKEASAGGESDAPKRVLEITVGTAAAEAAKDASKRRMMQRQAGTFRSADFLKRELVRTGKKKKAVMNRPAMKPLITTPSAKKRVVEMGEVISVEDFAKGMGVKGKEVFTKLQALGAEASEQGLDFETATVVAAEFGYTIKQTTVKEDELLPTETIPQDEWITRAPVVTIMGHVDHGKTSLLDKIRKTKVAEGEAGGITQHVGAYTVKHKKGSITFIDTPGHEAFTAMRARGAQVTDIVVLVVSATEGVMPQTVESINHAKAAGVPLIVAVNKIDLPEANPEKTKQTMAGYDLAPEEWGGDTIYANVSAKTGEGIDNLLESISLHAELLELKAPAKGPAKGVILESRMEKGRGAVATVLVQSGRLKESDTVICGITLGKVRALHDFQGKRVKEALPSDPVEIIGLPEVLTVGEVLHSMPDEKAARTVIDSRKDKIARSSQEARPKMTLEEMLAAVGDTKKELRVVLKSDVQGSVEAVKEALSKFPQEKVGIKYLHAAVGGITESDVMLASASQGVIFGFNVRPDAKATTLAEREKVEIRCYRVIYELVDEVKRFMEGLVDKKVVEKTIGRAEVRDVFLIPKIGAIAGSSVSDGKVVRGCFARLTRDSRVIYEGKISSLRRFKEDVREVTQGHECGIGLENFNDIKVGDQLEAFEKQELAGTL